MAFCPHDRCRVVLLGHFPQGKGVVNTQKPPVLPEVSARLDRSGLNYTLFMLLRKYSLHTLFIFVGVFVLLIPAGSAQASNLYQSATPNDTVPAASLDAYHAFSVNSVQDIHSIVNGNAALGVSGTVESFTVLLVDNPSTSYTSAASWGITGCSVAFTYSGGDWSCSGTAVNSYGGTLSVSGSYYTLTLNTPVVLNTGYYYMVAYRYSNQPSGVYNHTMGTVSGTSGGSCNTLYYDLNYYNSVDPRCTTGTLTNTWVTLSGAGGFVPPVVDTSTRIDLVTPPADFPTAWSGARATSTVFAFGADGYVNSTDYNSTFRVKQKIANNAQRGNLLAGPSFAFYQSTQAAFNAIFYYPISASGSFSVSTTTDVQTFGVYNMTTSIEKEFTVLGIGTGVYTTVANSATTTQFLVATTTVFDALAGQSTQAAVEAMNAYDASHKCTSWDWTDPDTIGACIKGLFVPSVDDIASTAQVLHDRILLLAPWGYATYAVDLLLSNDSATSTLPSFTLDVSTMVPGTSGTLDLTPWQYLAGPSSYLATKTIPQTGEHPLTKMLEDWNIFCYVIFGAWFVRRFFGAWQNAGGHSDLSLKEEVGLSVSARKRGGWGSGGKGVIH